MSMWEMVIYLVVNFMAINITVRFAECFLKNNIRKPPGENRWNRYLLAYQ